MLSISSDINAMPRILNCELDIDGNLVDNVKLLTYASDWSGDITIGQVVSSYITATIPTPNFSVAGDVVHNMGIGYPMEWVTIGQYRVDENSIRHRQGYTSFTAYDKLHDTVNLYVSSLTFPASLQAICDDVCYQAGITSTTLGISFTVTEDVLTGYTLRDVLGFIAAMCGKNAYVSSANQLELRWFADCGYTADNTRANVPYVGESDCIVNRLICQTANGVLTSGSGQGIYFTCPIMTQNHLDWLQNQLAGFTYCKAEVDIPYGNFCLQSGDIITVSTTGSNLSVPIMGNSWTYDGGVSSAVSAYGVSDYSGTANNAERSVSARRVKNVLDSKVTMKREQQQYASLQGIITHTANMITGASGGYIKIEFGGNGKTAQLLIMDEPELSDTLNVWVLNQNGIGHMQRAVKTNPFDPVNIALTRDGYLVAERIAGDRISGVKLETFYRASSGQQTHILIEDGAYTINKATVDSDGNIVGTPTFVGKMEFEPRTGQSSFDTVSMSVASGSAYTIGSVGNPEFIYYSDTSDPAIPSGSEKFQFLGGNIKLFGDFFFGAAGTYSLGTVKGMVDDHENAIYGTNGIFERLDDLERRVSALENA